MKMISIQVPVKTLARAVVDELNEIRGDKRAALIAAQLGVPGVAEAIDGVIAATDKADNAQHTRGEAAALAELFKMAKLLRAAVRYERTLPKETEQ